jgi:hypothetical protein
MKKFVLGPALAALAMFVFGAIYWMSPFPYSVLKSTADDDTAGLALAKIFPETGTYLIPGAQLDQKKMAELYKRGPSVQVQFVKEGHAGMEPATFIKGYGHYFVVSLLLAILLVMAGPALKGYSGRVKFTTLVGVAGSALIDYSDPIWWHHPWAWHLVCSLYAVLAFIVSGLVLAAFVKPAGGAATPTGT